ncbi:MAG: FMN-binding protein [Elusimicrobia bacterium]|nr:FMN-binding protein [Elusimicrobiota bacterium]
MLRLTALIALFCSSPAQARVLMSQKEALALAFPGGERVERRTFYLDENQRRAAQESARVKLESMVWTYYVGFSSRGISGYAYFETHLVRTMNETFMAVIDPDGSLRFVEMLAFLEPDDYLADARWLRQFEGRVLDRDLWLRRGIRNMTGASLTSQALTDGVRRVLAVHSLVQAEARPR